MGRWSVRHWRRAGWVSAVSHRHFSRQTDPTVHASVNNLANRTRLQMTVVIFIQNRLRSAPQECNFLPQLQSSHRRKSPQLVSWLLNRSQGEI